MKIYIALLSIALPGLIHAQVTVGKTVSAGLPANTSVSLEMGNPSGDTKGMVLPWVTSEAAVAAVNPVPGTLIFDSATQKIKYAVSATANSSSVSGWTDLSNGAQTPAIINIPDGNTEQTNAKVLIGGNPAADTTPGILVLGDTNKAMVLPRVASHNNIVNPSAGMMVFVTSTSQLAVFNGREWSFWGKP